MAEVVIDGVRYIPESDAALFVHPSLLGAQRPAIVPGERLNRRGESYWEASRAAFEQWLPTINMGRPGDVELMPGRPEEYRVHEVQCWWRAWCAGETFYHTKATEPDEWPSAADATIGPCCKCGGDVAAGDGTFVARPNGNPGPLYHRACYELLAIGRES